MGTKKQTGGTSASSMFKDLISPEDASSDLNTNTNLINTVLDSEKPTEWKPNNTQTAHQGFKSHNVDLEEYAPYIKNTDGSLRPFSVMDDIDELRAEGQSTGEKWAHGIPKFLTRTGTTVLGGTVGLLYGGTNFIGGLVGGDGFQASANSFFDNDFQRGLDGINEYMDGALPHYYTKAEKDYNFFQSLGTANFWLNDFSQGASFVLGAVLTEGLASGVSASSGVARAKNLFSNISKATGASKAKSFLFPKTSVPKGNSAFNTLLDKKRWGAAGTTLRQLGTGASYESGVEARHHYDETVRKLTQIHLDQNDNQMPEKEDMAKIEDLAVKSANSVFAANIALVGYGNYMMFPKIFGKGFNGTRNTLRGTIRESIDQTKRRIPLIGKDYQALYKSVGKGQAFTNNAMRILKVPMYEGFVEEGGQRLMDLSGQGAAEYWYNMKNDPGFLGMTGELINHVDDSFVEAYGTKEGGKEIGIGFLLGLLGLPGYTNVKTKEGKTKKQWGIGGIWQTSRDMKKDKAMIDALEATLKENPHAITSLKALTDRLVRAGAIQDASDFAQIIDSPYLWKNGEHDNIFTYTISRLQAGLEESILNDIDDIRGMGLEEFRETFNYNDLNDLTDIQLKEKQTQLVDMMDERVSTIKQTYEKVNGSFLNYSEDQKLAIIHALSVSENSQLREDEIYDSLKEILGVDELLAEEEVESRTVREERDELETRSRLKDLWRRMTSKQREDILALPEAKYMMRKKNISEFTSEDIQNLLFGLMQERKGIEDQIQALYEDPTNKPKKSEKSADQQRDIGGKGSQNKSASEIEALEVKYEKVKRKTEALHKAIQQGLDPELSAEENQLLSEWAKRDPAAYSLGREDAIQMLKDAKKLRARRHRALSMYNELLDFRDDVTQSWSLIERAKKGKLKTPPKMLGTYLIDENGNTAQNAEGLADKNLQRLFTKYQGKIVEFEYTIHDPNTKDGLLGLARNKGILEIVMSDVEKILKRRPELDEFTAIKTSLQLRGVNIKEKGNTKTYRFYVKPEKAITGQEDLLIAYPSKETLELLLRKKALEKLGENKTAQKELEQINKTLKTNEHKTSYQTKELNFLIGASNIKVLDQAHQVSEILDISVEGSRSEITNEIEALDSKIKETIEEIGKVSQELVSNTIGAAAFTKDGRKTLAKRIYNISRQESSLKEGLEGLEIKKQEAVDKLEILNSLIIEVNKATNPQEVQEKVSEFLQDNWKNTRQILEEHLNKGFFQSAAYSYPDMNIFSPVFENEKDKEKLLNLAMMVMDFSTNLQELPEELIGLLDKGTADIKHKLDLLLPMINQTRKLLHFKASKGDQIDLFGDNAYGVDYDLRFTKDSEKQRRARYEGLLTEYYKLKEEYDSAVTQLKDKVSLQLSPLFEEISKQTDLGTRLRLVTNTFVDNYNNVNQAIQQLTTPESLPVDHLDSHPGVSEPEFDSSKSQMDDVSFDKSVDANNVSEIQPKVYYNSPALIHMGVGKTAGSHAMARREFQRLEEESTKRKLTVDEENQLEAYRSQMVFFNWTSKVDKESSKYRFKNYRLRPTTRFSLEEEYSSEVYFYDHSRSSETNPQYSTLSYKGRESNFKTANLRKEEKETILLMVVDHNGVPIREEGHLVYTSMMGTDPYVIKEDKKSGKKHNVYRYGRADLIKTESAEEIPSVTINGKLFFTGEMKDEAKNILKDHKTFREKLIAAQQFKYLKISGKSFGYQILPLGVWFNSDGTTLAVKEKARNTIVSRENDVQDIDLRISNNAETNKVSIGAKEIKVDAGFYYAVKDGNLIRFKPNRLPASIQKNVYNLLRLWAKQVENSKGENPAFDQKTANYVPALQDKSIPDQLKQLIFFGKHSKSRSNPIFKIYTEGDVLYFGGNSISFKQLVDKDNFIEEHSILQNFLKELHVQVNSITLKDDIEARNTKHNKRSKTVEYREYVEIMVNDDLSPTLRKWDNYTHFLLGTRPKGTGVQGERTNEEIPLPVNMNRDLSIPNKDNHSYKSPQFENVYLIYNKNVTSEDNWAGLSELDAEPIVDDNDGRAAEVAGINPGLEESSIKRTDTEDSQLSNIVSSWLKTPEGSLENQTSEQSAGKFAIEYSKRNSPTEGKAWQDIGGGDVFNVASQGMNVMNTVQKEIENQQAAITSRDDSYTNLLDLKDSKKGITGPKTKRVRRDKIDTQGPTEQQIKEETERYSISYREAMYDPTNFEPMLRKYLEAWKKKNFGTPSDGAAMVAQHIEDYQLMDLYGEYEEFVKMVPKDKNGNPIFKVEVIQGLVNGSDWGYFKQTGNILLSNDAIRGTIFHEAFHGISYKLLSKPERVQLYNEVRGLKGKATTYQGAVKNLGDFSDLEADEWLAEEFRQYALNKGNYIIGSGISQSLIQKLFNFLYKFFNGLKSNKDLFKRIQTGYYNSGIEEFVTYDIAEALEGRSGASFSQRVKLGVRRDLNQGITVALGAKIADSKKFGFEDLIFVKNNPEAVSAMLLPLYGKPGQPNTVYSDLHDTIIPQHNALADRNDYLVDIEGQRALTVSEEIEFRNNEKDLDNIEEIFAVLEHSWESLVNVNLKSLERYKLGAIKIDVSDVIEKGVDENELSRDTLGIKPSNEVNLKNTIEPGIKLLLGMLPQTSTIKGKSNLKVSNSGVYKIADFTNIANTLYKKLANKSTIEESINALQELAKENKTYQVLLDRLNIPQGLDNFSDFTFERMKLLIGFLNNFNTTSDNYVMMLANQVESFDHPGRYFVNSNTDRVENIVKNAWNYKFKSKLHTGLGKKLKDGRLVLDINKELKIGNQRHSLKSWILTPMNVKQVLSLLGGIGFEYSNINKLIQRFENSPAEAKEFLDHARWVFSEISKKEGDLSSILEGDVEGNLKALIAYEVETSDLAITLQHITPLNKTVFGITRKSHLNIVIDKLNANDAEINRLMESPYMKGSLYNKERIIRTRTLEGGKNRQDGQGFDISKTTKGNIAAIHVNSILDGFVPLIRVGNKKQERSVQIGENRLRTDKEVIQYLKDLLLDEIITANIIRNNEELQQISGLKEKGRNLQFFNDSNVFNNITSTAENFINNGGVRIARDNRLLLEFINSDNVTKNINKFLEAAQNDNYKLLHDFGFLSKSPTGYVNVGIESTHILEFSGELNGSLSLDTVKKIVKKLTYTQLLNEIEQVRLFLGHPALYKNIFKRTSGMVGTKVYPSYNPSILSWMNENMPNLITKKKHTGTVKFVTRKEITKASKHVQSYINKLYEIGRQDLIPSVQKAYGSMDVFDGGGFVNLDFYRRALFLTNNWGRDHENAYQKLVNSIPLTEADLALFPPLKPQVFADYHGDQFEGLNLKVFNKFALFPIHPGLSKVVGMENTMTDVDNIHDDMIKKDLDYMVFESGTKVGAKTNSKGVFENFYSENGQYNYLSDASSVQSYDLEFFGMQLDPKMKVERKVRVGTQPAALTLMNVFQDGMINMELGQFDENRTWEDVSNQYNSIHTALISRDVAELAKKLGFIKSQDGFMPISTIHREKMLETILSELDARETSASVKDAVNHLFKQSITYTNQLANKQKLDELLYSIITNTVVNRKTNGSLSVLQSDIGFSVPGSQLALDDNLPVGMRPLKFYTFEEDGVTLNAMEVYLPHYLKKEYGKKLSITEFDEEALKLIGFGIPTEGLNSIDFIKVAGFLPHTSGANIIVPHEIVAKTGKDFDIDKFTLYLPNVVRNEDGVIRLAARVNTPQDLLLTDSRVYDAVASKLFGTNTGGLISFMETLEATRSAEPGPKSGIVLADLHSQLIDLGFNELEDIYRQPISVVQNDLISLMTDVLKHPSNFGQLIAPIGAFDLSTRAHEIHELQLGANISGVNQEYGVNGTLFEKLNIRNILQTTYQMYQTIGGTGIVAKNLTHLPKSQKANLKFSNIESKIEGDKSLRLSFEGFEDRQVSLSGTRDISGGYINRSMQEYVTAYVDGENDPFIMFVNGGQSGASVHMMLIRAGVPKSTVLNFMSQPIIHEYFNLKNLQSVALQTSKQSEGFSEGVVKNSLEKLVGQASTKATMLNDKMLAEMLVINLTDMKSQHKELQAQILNDFLLYKESAEELRRVQEVSGFDTDELKNGYNLIYLTALEKNLKTTGRFENLDNITEGMTYLAPLKEIFKLAPTIMASTDFKEDPRNFRVKEYMERLADTLIEEGVHKDDIIYKLKEFDNFITSYLWQTTPDNEGVTLNDKMLNLFQGPNSLPKLINKAKDEYSDNLLIKDLLPQIQEFTDPTAFDYSVDKLRLISNKYGIDEIDNLSDSWDELFTKEGASQALAEAILEYSIIKSGTQFHPTSFFQTLPGKAIIEKTKEMFVDNFIENPIEIQHIFEDFLDNSWDNPRITAQYYAGSQKWKAFAASNTFNTTSFGQERITLSVPRKKASRKGIAGQSGDTYYKIHFKKVGEKPGKAGGSPIHTYQRHSKKGIYGHLKEPGLSKEQLSIVESNNYQFGRDKLNLTESIVKQIKSKNKTIINFPEIVTDKITEGIKILPDGTQIELNLKMQTNLKDLSNPTNFSTFGVKGLAELKAKIAQKEGHTNWGEFLKSSKNQMFAEGKSLRNFFEITMLDSSTAAYETPTENNTLTHTTTNINELKKNHKPC